MLFARKSKLDKKANYLLGCCYFHGEGVAKDHSKAFNYFLESAQKGFGSAKDYLGDCYYYGYGTPIDYEEAARWYKDAADNHGIGNSAHSLAFMYFNGDGVEKDERKAVDYFLIAAHAGITQAQCIISDEYRSGRFFQQDYEEARKWMERAATKGDPEAQFMLGRYYVGGYGFDDEQKLYEWVSKAAEQGHVEAEYVVGGCFKYGMGVAEDSVQANKWFSKAAESGHALAQYELGCNLIDGWGIQKDTDRGVQLLIAAADANNRAACKELADRLYLGIENYNGQSRYTNPAEAQKYAMIAVQDDKDGDAQYRLATILHLAFGNPSAAKEWYVRAVANGNDKAKLGLSKLYIDNQENYADAVRMLQELADKNIGEAQYLLAVCYENGYGCQKDKKAAKNYYQMAERNGYVSNEPPRKKRFGLF